jgi:hypothetical protein
LRPFDISLLDAISWLVMNDSSMDISETDNSESVCNITAETCRPPMTLADYQRHSAGCKDKLHEAAMRIRFFDVAAGITHADQVNEGCPLPTVTSAILPTSVLYGAPTSTMVIAIKDVMSPSFSGRGHKTCRQYMVHRRTGRQERCVRTSCQ